MRRLSTLRHTCALVAAIAIALSAAAASVEPDQLVAAWNAAWTDRDAARLASLYTEEARVLTPNAPTVEGRDEIEAMFTRMMGRNLSISSKVTEEFESGDLRVLRTHWVMTIGTTEGVMEMDDGESLEVWRRIDDAWLLHFENFVSYNVQPISYDAGEPNARESDQANEP